VPASHGVVYAATGPGYTELAAQSARSLRAAMPGMAVDLWTDQDGVAGPFDRVHRLRHPGVRPKFEALADSRFDRTVCLDADTLVLAPFGDVFELSDRFDLALAHDQGRNNNHNQRIWRRPMPPSFPQLNTGVVLSGGAPEVRALFAEVGRVIRDEGLTSDQPVLRELLYLSRLRLAVLPPEYNLMYPRLLETQGQDACAPRILHSRRLHRHIRGDERRIRTVAETVGPDLAAHFERLRRADRTLDRTLDRAGRVSVTPLADTGILGGLRRLLLDLKTELVVLRNRGRRKDTP